jgi:6-phospho-beta-glucosidase
MRASAPGALLVNFTNPSGLVTQALSKYAPDVASVGVCNGPLTTKMGMVEGLEKELGQKIDPQRAELKTLGLNHLSWTRGLMLDGEELWPQVFRSAVAALKADPEADWDWRTVEVLGMIPNHYLTYFYHTDRYIAAQEKWPPSRAEVVMEVEKELLKLYADPALRKPPAELMKRGGAYYSTVAVQLLTSHYNDLGETHIVNVRQGGAVAGWPEDWVLEMASRVDRGGIHPLPAEPLPMSCFGLMAQVKAYELLTVEAAVHGDRDAAFQALLANPLGPKADRVQEVLDDMLETHRSYLPQFWR